MASQTSSENSVSLDEPKQAEAEGNLELAAELYEAIIQKEPLNEFAYNRLMILYRKQRETKKELEVIDKGLKAFQQFYASKHKHSKNSKIAQLSNELLLKTGLVDKKGNMAYEPEPIAKWKKRQVLVEKKLTGGGSKGAKKKGSGKVDKKLRGGGLKSAGEPSKAEEKAMDSKRNGGAKKLTAGKGQGAERDLTGGKGVAKKSTGVQEKGMAKRK